MLSLALALVLGTLDTASIQDALAGRGPEPEAYLLSDSMPVLILTTPFSRVAAIGAEARKEYREVRAADLPAAAIEDAFTVHASAFLLGGEPVNVTHIVAVAPDGTIVQPTTKRPVPAEWGNKFGAKTSGAGVEAVFPMAVLKPGVELRVITSQAEQRFKISQAFLDGIR